MRGCGDRVAERRRRSELAAWSSAVAAEYGGALLSGSKEAGSRDRGAHDAGAESHGLLSALLPLYASLPPSFVPCRAAIDGEVRNFGASILLSMPSGAVH